MFCLIFLAGGKGKRLPGNSPKQFCLLKKKPLALYSFEALTAHPKCKSAVVVAEKSFHHLFASPLPIVFALPGKRRQVSVENGSLAAQGNEDFFLIHDAARPFPPIEKIDQLLNEALTTGAASLAIPSCDTIVFKEKGTISPLPREKLWHRQTPQVIRKDLLKKGLDYVKKNNHTVTDDLSLVEALGKNTSLVEGSRENIKVTYPIDFILATQLVERC